MNKANHVFGPLAIGPLTAKNRIEVSPGANLLATEDGYVSRELIEWTRRMARGGAGIVTVGMSLVNPVPAELSGFVVDLSTDKVVNGLSRLVEAIHRYGALASIELVYVDFAAPEKSHQTSGEDLSHIRNETSINDKMKVTLPADLSQADIDRIIGCWARAAERCARAGMDMVLIHGAHEMFISQFLSPKKNTRTDRYGGSLENRSRFACELLDAIRKKVGRRMAIEYRLSAEELVPDGTNLEDTLAFARIIQDRIDLLHVSAGTLSDDQVMGNVIQPTYYERGINVHYAAAFKKVLDIPVTTVGSLDMDMAEEIIATGKADMVAMLRTIIADPDAVKKTQHGQGAAVRPCVRCNTCINRPHYYFLPVRCAVNPVAGREVEFGHEPPPARKKKVVVVGGGPAGMEAARTAAARGHAVVLYEKNTRLGGALHMAAAPPFKADMRRYLDWAVRMTAAPGNITINLGTEATPETVRAESPDALVLAVGGKPIRPDFGGSGNIPVVWAGDVVLGRVPAGDRVVIAGGGLTGCETALFLAQKGKRVTVVDQITFAAMVSGAPIISMVTLISLLRRHDVEIITERSLDGVTDTGALVKDKEGNKTQLPCDTLVLSLGFAPQAELAATFSGLAGEVYVAGDCAAPQGGLWNATTTGFAAAMDI